MLRSYGVVYLLLAMRSLSPAETLTVSGRGEAPVPSAAKKAAAAANQQGLAAAQEAARADAMAQAVFQCYGNREKLGSRADEAIRAVVRHSASMILDAQVRSIGVQGATASAEVVLKVDGKALRDYLEHSLGLSLAGETEGRFRTFVLAYTVEGMDPDRAKPQVLREEIVDDRKNVRNEASASTETHASAADASYSLDAAQASSDRGRTAHRNDASLQYAGSAAIRANASEQARLRASGNRGQASGSYRANAGVSGRANENLAVKQSSAAGAEWNRSNAGMLRERAAGSQASFDHQDKAHTLHTDTSSYYRKLVIYADTTKKGAGSGNEVRAKLGEMLKGAGLATAFYDIDLMGREFRNEDDVYHEILQRLKQDPEVKPEDCVAVALNRLTPADPAAHRFVAQVTYRVLRIRDGEILLPDKNVAGDSGEQPADDAGRTVATELALAKAAGILPGEITRAVRQTQRSEARAAGAASSEYLLRVDNVASPAATVSLKQALRSAGFALSTQFRGGASSESILVKLNGRPGSDASASLEAQLDRFDVVAMDDRGAVLKAR